MEGITLYNTLYFLRYTCPKYVNVCLETYGNNRKCLKLAQFVRKTQTSRVNNSRFTRIKNEKFSRYDF